LNTRISIVRYVEISSLESICGSPHSPKTQLRGKIDCSGNPCRSGARELDRSILREASKACPTARLSSSFPISSSCHHPRNTAIATREASATIVKKRAFAFLSGERGSNAHNRRNTTRLHMHTRRLDT
jgi:hypothetical protein